jgi:hypothetical protein
LNVIGFNAVAARIRRPRFNSWRFGGLLTGWVIVGSGRWRFAGSGLS